MLTPSQTGLRFAEFEGFAHGLSETTTQVCLLHGILALHQPAEAPGPPVGWRQRWMLLESGARTEVLREKLARALASELDAHLLLAAAAMPGEAGRPAPDGAASAGGGPRLRS